MSTAEHSHYLQNETDLEIIQHAHAIPTPQLTVFPSQTSFIAYCSDDSFPQVIKLPVKHLTLGNQL